MNIISRWETKYELDASSAQRLRSIVGRFLPVYEYMQGQPVTHVTTVYFDTARLDFFRHATRFLEDNVKIRVREYSYRPASGGILSLPYCFLEIKRRKRGLVTKRRLRVPKRLLDYLLDGVDIWEDLTCAFPEDANGRTREIYRELRQFLKIHQVFPRSVVHYRRWVYQVDEWRLRVTFDDDLRICSPGERLYDSSETLGLDDAAETGRRLHKVIMEIKCHGDHPPWLDLALKDFLPRKVSKFTESINILVN